MGMAPAMVMRFARSVQRPWLLGLGVSQPSCALPVHCAWPEHLPTQPLGLLFAMAQSQEHPKQVTAHSKHCSVVMMVYWNAEKVQNSED
jgi:hypothetical protein